jgi:hypothetical protein
LAAIRISTHESIVDCASQPTHHCNAWRKFVTISIANLQPIVALAAGVLILIMPRLLNYIVALYLIIVGILGLGILK